MKMHSRVLKGALVLFWLAVFCVTPIRGAEVFVRFGAVDQWLPGESRDAIFNGTAGWNHVSRFGWKVTAESSWTKGTGVSIGKPNPQAFVIDRRVDASSLGLLSAILTGRTIANVEVVVRDPTRTAEADPRATVLKYDFTAVLMTSIEPKGGTGNESPSETAAFVFKTVTVTYRPVDEKGNLGDAMVLSWDVSTGMVSGPQ